MPPVTIQQAMQIAMNLHATGQLQEAEAICRQVLAYAPNDSDALHLMGVLAHQCGREEVAMDWINQAIRINPMIGHYHNSLGEVCRALRMLDQAVECYRRAMELRPDCGAWRANLGSAFLEKKQYDEAILEYQRAIQLNPQAAGFYNNLGYALREKGDLDGAVVALRRAVELKPDYLSALLTLGNALWDRGDIDEAIANFRRAIRVNPSSASAHYNLSTALQEKGEIPEALAESDEAIRLMPDHAAAHLNRSLMLLLKGDFSAGWADYEWRRRSSVASRDCARMGQAEWKGEGVSGRTVLIYAEQGFGDTIQFVRYAPLMARRGGRVIVECQPELKDLFMSVEGVQQVVAKGEALPRLDLHIPMLSLPHVFGTTLEDVPAEVPYLFPDKRRIGCWQGKLARYGLACKVGLVWSANPKNRRIRGRSMSLCGLAPLSQVQGIVFFSLQKGEAEARAKNPPSGMNLVDLTADLKDFADTAALITQLDLVISVDTAVAHLAGAMGKPVWTTIPFPPAWQWLLDREDSPWYPTMRLFRQPAPGDWASVIRRVADELEKLVRARTE